MSLKEQIEKVLDEVILPRLQMHKGGVEIVEVDEEQGTVKLKFTGMCEGCPLASLTFEGMVEGELMAQIPELKKVEAINLN